MLGCQRQVSYFAGLPRRKLGHVHGNSQSGKVNRDIIDVYMRRKYQVCDKYDVLIFPLKNLLLFFADLESTLIFFVSPHALLNALEDACSVFGPERRCCLARELTKTHEEFWRSSLKDALDEFRERGPRGEFTLVIEGSSGEVAESTDEEIVAALKQAVDDGVSPSQAARQVATDLNVPKKRVYNLSLQLKN